MSNTFPMTRAVGCLRDYRERFVLPEGVIYLDGNSLGALPKATEPRVREVIAAQWGKDLIKSWNLHDWIGLPRRVGAKIARLIGAKDHEVVVADSTSLNVFKALHAALGHQPGRRVILSDDGNFPTDLYMAQGLARTLGNGVTLKVVAPEAVADALDDSVAVLMLTEVDYRTGRLHDMGKLTKAAHSVGAVTVWDLAHSAGAIPVDLAGADADFAVGCTYKYLNGGPGAPAFIYVASRHAEVALPALSGWMGHAAPFAFDLDYKPGSGIERMRVGTPPILALAALDAALDAWEGVSLADVRRASIRLSERFIAEAEARCPGLVLASPRDPTQRGSQVSFRHPEGYAIMRALIDRGVIGDFRAPDALRFGFTPLYLDEAEVVKAVEILETVMAQRLWDRDDYRRKEAVT